MPVETTYPWAALGLAKMPADAADIRRAYARTLKQIDQATDMAGFTALRAAYEAALAIRAGRDVQNLKRRAGKPEIAADQANPSPPAPAPAEDLRRATQDRFLTLLDILRDGQSAEPFALRLQTALENPLSRDPDYAPAFRNFTARLLHAKLTTDENGTATLAPEVTRDTLLALDARFDWLTDYAAFRQDFGHAAALQDLIIRRAYDDPALDITYAPQQAKKSSVDGRVLVFGAIALLKLAAVASSNASSLTEKDLWAYGALIAYLAALYWLFKQLGKKFSTAFTAILTGWFGFFLPAAVASQFSDNGENFSILAAWLFATAAFLLPIALPKLWQHLRTTPRAKPPAKSRPISKRAKIEFSLLATLAAAVLCFLGISLVNAALSSDTKSLQNLASTMIIYGGIYSALNLWQGRKPIGLTLGIGLWFGLGALDLFFPLQLVAGTTDNSPLVAWMAITLLVCATRLFGMIAGKLTGR